MPNWIIALATIATFIVANGQRSWAKKQSGIMRATLDETAKATAAAKRSAEIADLTLTLTQRPYLAITDWTVTRWDAGAPPVIVGIVQNDGATVARDVRVEGTFRVRTEPSFSTSRSVPKL
jgi:hypothetical protein